MVAIYPPYGSHIDRAGALPGERRPTGEPDHLVRLHARASTSGLATFSVFALLAADRVLCCYTPNAVLQHAADTGAKYVVHSYAWAPL